MSSKSQYKLNAFVAVIFGLSIIIAESLRRFDNWGYWARWMDDFLMGLFLIVPAIMVLKGFRYGKKLLIGGWGFSCGLFYGSFFSKIGPTSSKFQTNIPSDFLVILIGFGFAVSIVGLIWILALEKKESA